ncbi:hypothetical protein BDY19DRAFT_634658 [Irpex rosettiformis]|uniref:Uncharacterized protein n=1 Tax=Irpex rosettiformis TaxID=378272 RepID=A0ACB8UB76_9APHY|nr:hypothetical protein BDY19DRAFT_634658 [Irpex rosettiformis]
MGQKHIEFHCSICLGWKGRLSVQVLRCGHIYCVGCMAQLTAHGPRRCPTCRTGFNPREASTLYCEVRDIRTRKLLKARKALELPPADSVDLQSSSRAGTPSQYADDDDEDKGYPDTVHTQAARVVSRLEEIGRSVTAERMKRAGKEVKGVADAIGLIPGDNVQRLLKELAIFLMSVAAPLFAEAAAKQELKDAEMRKLTMELLNAKRSIKRTKESKDSAENLLEKALATTATTAEENIKLKSTVEGLKQTAAATSQDLKQLAGVIETKKRLEAANQARARKAERMEKEIDSLRMQLDDARQQLREQQTQLARQASPSPDLIIASEQGLDYDLEQIADVDNVSLLRSSTSKQSISSKLPLSTPSTSSTTITPGSRPTFGSDWNIKRPPSAKRKRPNDQAALPLKFKPDGRPNGALYLGPRTKLNRFN